tara:strand:+ start:802 stop:1053 length:252 start_codon:yes stop_codon:yes gene_type:complete
MGKAWKRLRHRQRTWGAKQEAPQKVEIAPAPTPAAIEAPKEEVNEVEEIAKEAIVAPVAKPKAPVAPKTKRIKRKSPTTKKNK